MNNKVLIVIVAVLTGFILASQIAANKKVDTLTKGDSLSVLSVETAELIKNIDKLETERKNLDDQNAKLKQSGGVSKQALADDIAKLTIISGNSVVKGQGVEINFDKALAISELTDLVNALRNIGIEGISVNNRRIVEKTGFVVADGEPPVVVRAIGNKDLLQRALRGILEQIDQGNVAVKDEITLPAVVNK